MITFLRTATFVLLALCQSSFLQANEFVNLSLSGSEVLYPLPSGYCDVTEDFDGIMLKEFLDAQTMPGIPKAQAIVKLCDRGNEDTGYPWAWIGVLKNEPRVSQKNFNKMMASFLKNDDMLEKLNNKVLESNRELVEDFLGVETTNSTSKQQILWADDKSMLLGQKFTSNLGGDIIEEVILTSASVVNNLYVYTYIYNLKDALPSTAELSELLIDNASKLNDLNF